MARAYRVTDWLKQAPFQGIVLDETNVLLGQSTRSATGDGKTDYNDLLCGKGAPIDAHGNCARVNKWNDAMATILQRVTDALHPLGDEVLYNGIAPSVNRGPTRNLGLLDTAGVDGATNEDFCYGAGANQKANPAPKLTSITDDAAIMQQQAAKGKKIFEITNYQNQTKRANYGAYCLAGFLMGWQPGSDWWIYHQNYNDDLTATYPEEPEQNLNLGLPVGTFAQSGTVLTRRFKNGFVAVNTGDSPASLRLPSSLVQYSGGHQGRTYQAGATVALGPRSGLFFLIPGYVAPAATPTSL